jgi:hypothetical protein
VPAWHASRIGWPDHLVALSTLMGCQAYLGRATMGARMRVAEAFAAAYALGSSAASLVYGIGLIIVPRLRRRFAVWRGNRRIAEYLAEVARSQ